MSKRIRCWQNCWLLAVDRTDCNGQLFTGYRPTGIKTTGTLHRLLSGTREAYLLMCQKLCRKFFLEATVHQMIYSSYCNSILSQTGKTARSVGRSHSSDEVFVMRTERRASVIQSKYFITTIKTWEDCKRK